MKIAKKVVALALAAVMCIPTGFVAKDASAQEIYETKGVVIYTDLVPNSDDIKVTEPGKAIETKTNVQFDLDCNVDCTWRVREQNNGVCNIYVDSMGHVSIPSTVDKGTYYVDAVANTNRLINSQDTTVSCKINVGDKPAKSSKVVLDKEAIESQPNARGIVKVTDKGVVVDGSVRNVELFASVSPDYLLDNSVTYSFNSNVKGAKITNGTFLSTYEAQDAITGETLYATVGSEENNNHEFDFEVNKKEKFDFYVKPDIKLTQSENKDYNMQMNQRVVFAVDEYSDTKLPTAGEDTGVTWAVSYGNNEAVDITSNKVKIDLCTITFENNGKNVIIETPNSKSADAEKYIETVKAANGKDALVLVPTLNLEQGVSLTYEAVKIVFSDKEASFKDAIMNLANIGYVENEDYVIKKEKLGDELVDVYYMESDNRNINLVNITDSDVDGIADFDDSRNKSFSGDTARYTVSYSLTDIDPKTFGEATPNYINKVLDEQINDSNMIKVPTRFEKKGIGYKKLTIECSGAVKSSKTYVLRFVTDAGNISIRHIKYENDNIRNEYIGASVVHVRKGERDDIRVVRYYNSNDEAINQLSVTDPYIEYTFTKIKGDQVASATTAKEHVQINGLNTGKVLVTATSVVDKREFASFTLYVNDEVMKPEGISIDTSEAQTLGMITAQGEVKGKVTDIPLGVLAHGSEALGVPTVQWSVSDEKYATITQDGRLSTITSTGGNTIKVIATSMAYPDIKAELVIKITDVAATEIDTIGELVTDGMPAMVEEGTQKNTGSCKANTAFKLVPKVYLPLNQTSADGEITWVSSNPEVATIDNSGNVVALTEGETRLTITYTPKASSAKSTVYTLNVSGMAVNVTSISCQDTLVLSRVGATETLAYSVLPENASNKSVQFISSDESIVSVTDTGVVTAKAPGNATITIASVTNPSVKKIVTVTVQGLADNKPGQGQNQNGQNTNNTPIVQNTPVPQPVVDNTPIVTGQPDSSLTNNSKKNVVIKLAKKSIKKGKSTTIKITNATKKAKVTYTLDKKSKKIVSVSKKGVVKGKKKGTAKITVKVKQGGKTYKKTLTIKVK